MSSSKLEALYTPSKWSKRFDQTTLLSHYYNFSKEVSENARKTLKCELDVPYGGTERTKYDIYGTDLPKAPVYVRKGIKVIVVGYDLCPNVKLRDIVSQIKSAVEHILKSALSLGCRNVWISGHSAGAHLATSLLYDKLWLHKIIKQGYLNLLKGIVLIGGVYNLKPLVETSISTVLNLTKDEIDTYSFNALDTKNSTSIQRLKIIVTVGECDSPGLINESRECAQKLVTMVDNVQYIFLRENIDHFDIVEKLTEAEFILTKIILNNVFNE